MGSYEALVRALHEVQEAMNIENAAWRRFAASRSAPDETVWLAAQQVTDAAWRRVWSLRQDWDRAPQSPEQPRRSA